MQLTCGQLEAFLCKGLGGFMSAAGLNVSIQDGTNPDLNWPIGAAVRDCGFTVANPARVVDADIAQIPDAQTNKLFDLARYQTVQFCLDNYQPVDQQISLGKQAKNQLREAMVREVKRMADLCLTRWGVGKISAPSVAARINSVFPTPNLPVTGPIQPPTFPWGLGDGRVDH